MSAGFVFVLGVVTGIALVLCPLTWYWITLLRRAQRNEPDEHERGAP